MNGCVGTYESWKSLRNRVETLPADRQGAFALACAQGAAGLNVELLGSLNLGWEALVGHGDVTQALVDLERDHALDDDAVAATHYALHSVQGQAGSAWWAASRAMDQAFAGVEYPADAVEFRPVEADALSAVVQSESTRQLRLLQAAESAKDLTAAVVHLRPNEEA